MIGHPRFQTLARFADGELGPAARTRVAAHLADCARCRGVVARVRAATAEARAVPVPPLPTDGLARVLSARAAGARVLLPVETTTPPRRRAVRVGLMAAAAVLVAALGVLLAPPDLQADRSELRLLPSAPRAGDAVSVQYRATALLSAEQQLVLRGRLRVPGRAAWAAETRVLTPLVRGSDGVFRGRFVLPDSALYAVLAVEDTGATRIDANAQQWDLLLHGGDGRPLREALQEKAADLGQRDTRQAVAAARELAQLYPDAPESWSALYRHESAEADSATVVRLDREHRLKLKAFSERSRRGSPPPEQMAELTFYAGMLGDTVREHYWGERLVREHPRHPYAVQQRVFQIRDATRGDRSRLIAEMERLWAEVGAASGQLPFSAFQLATQIRDPAALRRWGERLEEAHPEMSAYVARQTIGVPTLREDGMRRLRQVLRRLERPRPEERPLTMTATARRAELDAAMGDFLGMLGEALVRSGQARAAVDTLARATRTVWSPPLLRTAARLRLGVGDTAGALADLARVAVDPTTPLTFADSAHASLGARFDDAAWVREKAAGADEMRRYLARQQINRRPREALRVSDPAGRRRTLDPEDGPLLVAFWSRFCPPSRAQLVALDGLARRMQASGVRVAAVTEEVPSAALSAFLVDGGHTFPVFHDVDRTAARAFGGMATPTYFVVHGGRIRFQSHEPDDVERHFAVLRAHVADGKR